MGRQQLRIDIDSTICVRIHSSGLAIGSRLHVNWFTGIWAVTNQHVHTQPGYYINPPQRIARHRYLTKKPWLYGPKNESMAIAVLGINLNPRTQGLTGLPPSH